VVTEDVAGGEIELDRVYDGLRPGRLLIVAGERADVPFTSGVPGSELTMVGGVRQRVDPDVPGSSVQTVLLLATPLAYSYRRDTVRIYGNVVGATQGETRAEVLGSGAASSGSQSFQLRQVSEQKPLTALPADNPQGFDEALLVTPHGRVLEAPTSSIFWVSGEQILTPPLEDHILASITRALVIDVSDVRERPCTLEDLAGADEAFLASTTREVHPVAAVDDSEFNGIGPVTARTAAAVADHIRSELGGGCGG